MMTDIEKIWKEYNAHLRRFIRRRVADESAVDDILQEIFVKIHLRVDTLRDNTRIQSWLYRITRNAIIDHYRSRRPMEEIPEQISPSEVEDNKVMAELAGCVRPMIEALPGEYSEALALSELKGLTQKQVAEKLGLSLSGAKSRVQRGRIKLKEVLMDCCHFEFDRRGGVVDFIPKRGVCKNC